MQQTNVLLLEHNDAGSLGWFFNDQLQFNANEKTISRLPKVWDVGFLAAARGGRLDGAVEGGGVLPRACLHHGPGRDHETGNLAQPRASASVHSRGEWESDCLSHQCVAQSTVGQLGADICTVAWNWLASTRGRTTAGHNHCITLSLYHCITVSLYHVPVSVSVCLLTVFITVSKAEYLSILLLSSVIYCRHYQSRFLVAAEFLVVDQSVSQSVT